MAENKRELRYKKIGFLGEGQYAMVYKADDVLENKIVAIKKIKMSMYDEYNEGVNLSAIREIKALKNITHENIIKLFDVFGTKNNINLVYDYMETDLLKIIEDPHSVLSPSNLKSYMLMSLRGLEFLHYRFILHRDLKPSNLLIDRKGILKLGDLGLARSFGHRRPMTSLVVTRWYRAPELLYGARHYGVGIDTWSMGCILCEMLKRLFLCYSINNRDKSFWSQIN
ncbi:hypothetical protein HZS_1743 [Henneguya salminicola]|nr:hypothetical protein HZS_1743 [Henneguya salminicola]